MIERYIQPDLFGGETVIEIHTPDEAPLDDPRDTGWVAEQQFMDKLPRH